jgi:hypothetical protein
MNPNYTSLKFPDIKAHPWHKVFKSRLVTPEALDLVAKVLQYTPTNRLKPFEVCAHPFFDELRDPAARLPSGKPLPPLYNFTIEGISCGCLLDIVFNSRFATEQAAAKGYLKQIIPPHAMHQLQTAQSAPSSSLPSPSPQSSSLPTTTTTNHSES